MWQIFGLCCCYGKLFENCFFREGVTSFLMKFSQNFICVFAEHSTDFRLFAGRGGWGKRETTMNGN